MIETLADPFLCCSQETQPTQTEVLTQDTETHSQQQVPHIPFRELTIPVATAFEQPPVLHVDFSSQMDAASSCSSSQHTASDNDGESDEPLSQRDSPHAQPIMRTRTPDTTLASFLTQVRGRLPAITPKSSLERRVSITRVTKNPMLDSPSAPPLYFRYEFP